MENVSIVCCFAFQTASLQQFQPCELPAVVPNLTLKSKIIFPCNWTGLWSLKRILSLTMKVILFEKVLKSNKNYATHTQGGGYFRYANTKTLNNLCGVF